MLKNRWTFLFLGTLMVGVLIGVLLSNRDSESAANDGRLNTDNAANAVVYCDGGVSVWTVDGSGNGAWAFTVAPGQLADGLSRAANANAHQVVGQSGDTALYALKYPDTPQLQLQRGDYNFVFSANACGAVPVNTVAQNNTAPQQEAAPSQAEPQEQNTTTQDQPNDQFTNRCDPGNVWGDGRCLDDDPVVQEHNFNVGYYYQRLDDGDIVLEEIPPQYRQYTYEQPEDPFAVPINPDPGAPAPGGPVPDPGTPPVEPPPSGLDCSTNPPPDITPYLPSTSGMDDRSAMLTLVNAARSACGLGMLSLNGALNTAAQWHSDDMVARGYFSHDAPDPAPYGVKPWDRAQAAGYGSGFIGENIAAGFGNTRSAFLAWWNSSGHRANILRSAFRDFGFGRNGGTMTQLFGR
jgi:uncharacterized protein YkwD